MARPKLGPWLGIINQILVDDQSQPKKQRNTAKRIFDRLKAEHPRLQIACARLRPKEVFVPWVHPLGRGASGFRRSVVGIAGVEQKADFQCFDLP